MLVRSNVRVRSNSDFDPCQRRVRLSPKRDLTHFFRDYGSGSVDQSGRPLAEAAHRAPYDNQLSFEVRASRIQDRPEHRLLEQAALEQNPRLVLARLFKLAALVLDFIEQPYILDGYRSLVGEGRDQFDLLVSEPGGSSDGISTLNASFLSAASGSSVLRTVCAIS
jgi:hypothetical protein